MLRSKKKINLSFSSDESSGFCEKWGGQAWGGVYWGTAFLEEGWAR